MSSRAPARSPERGAALLSLRAELIQLLLLEPAQLPGAPSDTVYPRDRFDSLFSVLAQAPD